MAGRIDTGTWIRFRDGAAEGVAVRRCRLSVTRGPGAGTSAELAVKTLRVGARRGADFIVADPEVSGLHFEIVLTDDGFRLRDLDSTNGTFVDGMRVFDVAVAPGTRIGLGTSEVLFEPLDAAVEMPLHPSEQFGEMVGRAPVMRELFARLARIAATDATVVITGETGTGKDTAAESIHLESERKDGPFVVLDCGMIAANLIESEIFGHDKGAFTGATTSRAGAFERAHGGTLFLDEIGELPLELQPKLLRALERRRVRRVGGDEERDVDVRFIAATNRDLAKQVNRGQFREDLYYRLAVAVVEVPPLRDHPGDVPLLVSHFLDNVRGGEHVTLKPKTLEILSRHDWPGNVRELRNVVDRAVALREEPTSATSLRKLAPRRRPAPDSAPQGADTSNAAPDAAEFAVAIDLSIPLRVAKQEVIDEFERRYVGRLLEQHEYNLSSAARAAGTNRMTLHKIAERLGLRKKR